MREVTGHAMEPVAGDTHVLQPVIERARLEPARPVAAYRSGDGFVDVTASDVYGRIRTLARGLIASGVEPGDRVALMSRTRLEWMLLDYAIVAAGAVTVPIYETSSAEQVQWIVDDSGAVLLIVETPAMAPLYHDLPGRSSCREVLVVDDGAIAELERRGSDVDDATLDGRIAGLRADDLATIIYTSGTTGRPKGCVLTHGNLCTNVRQNIDAVREMLRDDDATLVFLPLAHALTKIISLVATEWGIKVGYATDIGHLQEELPMVRPTMVVAVPRVFEKVYNGARQKASSEGHEAIFDKAADVAIEWSEGRSNGGFHPITGAEHAVFERLVYAKIQEVFGGRLRFAFSGGGPLGERLTHFFNGVGVKIFEGYGLTETSPTLTVNSAEAWKPGTVGRPLAGTTIRIADDGEILAKGPQVFGGYWHNEAANAETFDEDGWFRTGDIGAFDDEGYLRITGRKKELLVTAAGKNVAPEPLEDRLRAHPLISQAVVVGDNRPFIAAMITIDEEAIGTWATQHGKDGATVADLTENRDLREVIEEAVTEANTSVSHAEAIKKFVILPADLTVDRGELTPTLKVRRAVVQKTYSDVIEHLYDT